MTLDTHTHLITRFVRAAWDAVLSYALLIFWVFTARFCWCTSLKIFFSRYQHCQFSNFLFSSIWFFQDAKVLFVILLLSISYLCLWWHLINSQLVKCSCVDVTDPSLFMFTRNNIDSGHGVALLFSSSLYLSRSLSHKLFFIFTLF